MYECVIDWFSKILQPSGVEYNNSETGAGSQQECELLWRRWAVNHVQQVVNICLRSHYRSIESHTWSKIATSIGWEKLYFNWWSIQNCDTWCTCLIVLIRMQFRGNHHWAIPLLDDIELLSTYRFWSHLPWAMVVYVWSRSSVAYGYDRIISRVFCFDRSETTVQTIVCDDERRGRRNGRVFVFLSASMDEGLRNANERSSLQKSWPPRKTSFDFFRMESPNNRPPRQQTITFLPPFICSDFSRRSRPLAGHTLFHDFLLHYFSLSIPSNTMLRLLQSFVLVLTLLLSVTASPLLHSRDDAIDYHG